MAAVSRSTRLVLAGLAGAVLITLVMALWLARGAREAAAPDLPAALNAGTAPQRPGHALSSLPADVGQAEPEGTAAGEIERRAADGDDPSLHALEILVRTQDELLPLADAELIYFDGGDDLRNELELAMEINGLDLDVLRRTGRRARTDDSGRAHLRCRLGKLDLLALASTHFGYERFEFLQTPAELLVVECQPLRLEHVRVVDGTGRPLGGIPVFLYPKERGLFSFTYGATSRKGTGLCEFGPLERDDDEVWIARVAGLFAHADSVEVLRSARGGDPVELVLPDHGVLEVRLLGTNAKPYPGTAKIEVVARAANGEEQARLEGRVLAGTGMTSFAWVGLDLSMEVAVDFGGAMESRMGFQGLGPQRPGERARIDIELGADFPCISGRVVDDAGKPLRFRELEFAGACSSDGLPFEFTTQTISDSGGHFSFCLDQAGMSTATGRLLVYCEMGADALGTLVDVDLKSSRAELGACRLSAAPLIAAGRVLGEDGNGIEGTNLEFHRPAELGPRRLFWTKPALSAAEGEFELHGWCAAAEIELRASFRRGPGQALLRLAPGARGVILRFR